MKKYSFYLMNYLICSLFLLTRFFSYVFTGDENLDFQQRYIANLLTVIVLFFFCYFFYLAYRESKK